MRKLTIAQCIFRPRPECPLKFDPIKIIIWTPACELMLQWYIRVLKVTWNKKCLYDILPFSCLTFYVFNKLVFSFKHSKAFFFGSSHLKFLSTRFLIISNLQIHVAQIRKVIQRILNFSRQKNNKSLECLSILWMVIISITWISLVMWPRRSN